jgi:hypothetical protein
VTMSLAGRLGSGHLILMLMAQCGHHQMGQCRSSRPSSSSSRYLPLHRHQPGADSGSSSRRSSKSRSQVSVLCLPPQMQCNNGEAAAAAAAGRASAWVSSCNCCAAQLSACQLHAPSSNAQNSMCLAMPCNHCLPTTL